MSGGGGWSFEYTCKALFFLGIKREGSCDKQSIYSPRGMGELHTEYSSKDII